MNNTIESRIEALEKAVFKTGKGDMVWREEVRYIMKDYSDYMPNTVYRVFVEQINSLPAVESHEAFNKDTLIADLRERIRIKDEKIKELEYMISINNTLYSINLYK